MRRFRKVAIPEEAVAVLVLVGAKAPPTGAAIDIVTVPLKLVAVLVNWSRALTVTPPEPALIAAPAVVFPSTLVNSSAAGGPGFTVTVSLSAIATLLITAAMTFSSAGVRLAFVEFSVQVATPLAFVVTGPNGTTVFPVPVTEIVALTFATGLLPPSRAVTVIVDCVNAPGLHPVLHAVIVLGLATTVDVLGSTGAVVMLNVGEVPFATP